MRYLFAIIAALCVALAAAPAQAQAQYPSGYYGQPQGWHGVLSAPDQQQFDKHYKKWVDASRNNDQDDIASNAQHMQDIMSRYNIPPNTPFEQVASAPVSGPYAAYPNGPYAGAYPGTYPAYGQVRLSPDDQKNFDKAYSKWVDAQRNGDEDDVANNARKMQEVMARYNIPPNTPFEAIATNGYGAAQPGVYGYPYAYPPQAQRLSAKDQSDFDKAYRKWVNAERKKDMDDVNKNARKMEDIMARYNIPANVPFDRIASPGSAYR